MTVQAGSPCKITARRAPCKRFVLAVGPVPFMAVLAQVGDFLDGQLLVPATVCFVAGCTIFLDGWMLPEEGSALVSVALVAELVEALVTNVSLGQGSVRVMAVTTGDLAFLDRMAGGHIGFNLDVNMTAITGLRHGCQGTVAFMNTMARGAADVTFGMLAGSP